MVLLWKEKVGNQNQSLSESKKLEIQEESYWFHNIYDSQKDYDSSKTMTYYSKTDWNWKIIIQRLKDHWKTMT